MLRMRGEQPVVAVGLLRESMTREVKRRRSNGGALMRHGMATMSKEAARMHTGKQQQQQQQGSGRPRSPGVPRPRPRQGCRSPARHIRGFLATEGEDGPDG